MLRRIAAPCVMERDSRQPARLPRSIRGGGWPCRAITEILTPQPAVLEFHLLGGAIRQLVQAGERVLLIGPLKPPYLPGCCTLVLHRLERGISRPNVFRDLASAGHLVEVLAGEPCLLHVSRNRAPTIIRRLEIRLE